jgi:iron-sulfur cluster assembly protein
MIHLSPVAINEIKRLQSKQQPNTAVQLAVRSGGCSGLFYDLSFLSIDGEAESNLELDLGKSSDTSVGSSYRHTSQESLRQSVNNEVEIFITHDLKIITDAQSFNYIQNLIIDYSEDLMGGGFRFTNPQATLTCGCGNSFSVS